MTDRNNAANLPSLVFIHGVTPDFNEQENAVLPDWLQDNVSAREA